MLNILSKVTHSLRELRYPSKYASTSLLITQLCCFMDVERRDGSAWVEQGKGGAMDGNLEI
jgi:hypothetical protein